MIDEIDYFSRRENFQKKKKTGDDWDALKQSRKPRAKKKEPGSKPESESPEKPNRKPRNP